MNIKRVIALTALLLFVLFLCSFRPFNTNGMSGEILLCSPLYLENSWQGVVTVNPQNKTLTDLRIQGSDACFFDSTHKILVDTGNNLELFDLKTMEIKTVYESQSLDALSSFAYAGKKRFSVVDSESKSLILVDLDLQAKTVVAENLVNPEHTWNDSGTVVYYCIDSHMEPGSNHRADASVDYESTIVKLDLTSGKITKVCNGVNPRLSKDGTKLGYCDPEHTRVYVLDLEHNSRWVYDAPIHDFCFSPDGLHLATTESWRGFGLFSGDTVRIVDYKTGRTTKIIPKAQDNRFCIDWN